ncbi:MAG TPA: hypothetical protein VEB22_15180 [Phycisphaerales bacterium]|nr:hypothetical protein [Phycisphaerales bacterium]
MSRAYAVIGVAGAAEARRGLAAEKIRRSYRRDPTPSESRLTPVERATAREEAWERALGALKGMGLTIVGR